jgi:hypothetical protein
MLINTLLKKPDKSDCLIFGALFLIALLFVFSSTYNPFNFRSMPLDSSVFMAVTHGISIGQLPYRDLADNKGPLLYLMNVPGFMLGSFAGVWITELILMCIAVLFAYKTALFFGGKYAALCGTAFTFVAALAFFDECIGVEEYSLPFLMISLYIFTKYYFSPKHDVSIIELIVLGICFASSVLIRINMFTLWAGFCFVVFLELIMKAAPPTPPPVQTGGIFFYWENTCLVFVRELSLLSFRFFYI